MKGFVHQIYCTHCTYGTSAVEQRQGDMADRVLGYGARASSLETADLRKHYREIERFLYYTLSVDSPSDEKKRLTAETAPRRLVYCPAIGGVKMLGQMSYRQTDTAGRPGSYFGHVLIADRAESWSVLDCLQTWGAPWCDQDSPALQFKLPTLPSVKAVHASSRPSIDDAVLLSFLKTPAGGAFDDPHGLIPPRWRAAPQHERLELLADSLRAFLHLAVDRRESLLLVVEPSVATLIFYGIARLLPPGSLRDELSFSTFEHNTDRLPVTLAATTFHAPETSDLKPDAYRGRGYVHNTYLKKGSTAPRTPSQYAALMVDTLATEGIAAVDAMHVDFSVAAPKKSEDLELLAQARNKVTALLAPSSPAVTWKDGVEAEFLASSIRRELAFADANSPVLAGVVGSANHLAVLELIATNTDVGTREAVRHLSLTLPSRMLSAFVDSQRIADDAKLAPVLEHIRKHKNFPPNCESLWSRPAAPGRQRPAAGVQGGLLPKILEQVSAAELAPLYEHVPLNGRIAYLTSLLVVCRNDSSKAPVLDKLIEAVDEDAFAHLLETHAEDLRRNFSRKDPMFGKRLNQALFGLVHSPRQFLHRLDLLAKWLEYFPDIVNTEHRLENWRKVYRTFETVKNSAPKANAGLLEKLTGGGYELDEDRLGWSLAESMKVAMPSAYCDDPDGSLKIGFLKEFGAIMLGSSTFLGPEVWRRIDYFYESGQWSAPISNRGGAGFQKAGGLTSPRNLMIGGAAAVVVVTLLIMLRLAASTPDVASKPSNSPGTPAPATSTTNSLPAKEPTNPPPPAVVRATTPIPTAIQTGTPSTSAPANTTPSFTDPPKPKTPETQPASTPTPQPSATVAAQTPSNGDMSPPAAATSTQTPQTAPTSPPPMPPASATAPAVASATGRSTGTPAAMAKDPPPTLQPATNQLTFVPLNPANDASPQELVKLTFTPKELTLHIPERMKAKLFSRFVGKLASDIGPDDRLYVAGSDLKNSDDDSITKSAMGEFWVEDHKVRFRWTKTLIASDPSNDSSTFLRYSVLEVASGANKQFIPLYKQIPVSISPSQLVADHELLVKKITQESVELVAGPPAVKLSAQFAISSENGRLRFEDYSLDRVTFRGGNGDVIEFARPSASEKSTNNHQVTKLDTVSGPNPWMKSHHIQSALVKFLNSADVDKKQTWKLSIDAIPTYKTSAEEKISQFDYLNSQAVLLRKLTALHNTAQTKVSTNAGYDVLKEDCEKLATLLNEYGRLFKTEIIYAVPPLGAAKPGQDPTRAWLADVNEKLGIPAKAARDALYANLTKSDHDVLKTQLLRRDEVTKLNAISGVIYRRVGPLEVPDIVIGDINSKVGIGPNGALIYDP